MNIVCAYCHIKGHHIKFCEELKEKNRRAATKQKVLSYHSQPVIAISSKLSVPKQKVNMFMDLYSSEEEEGEIVEERIVVPAAFEEETDASWTRSGVKGVVIKMPKCEFAPMCDADSDSDLEENPRFLETLQSLRDYVSRWDGMSWADIEYDTDAE